MPKRVKIALYIFIPLMLILGMTYGLARIGVIPTQKMAERKPLLQLAFRLIGLYHPVKAPRRVASAVPPPDPMAGEKQAVKAERDALDQERANWETQKQAQIRADQQAREAAANALPDPKELARLASIYEQMPADTVNKIFLKLPEDEVLGLLRRMDEKQVAQIMAGMTTDRAARLTQFLSRPAPSASQQSASLSP